MTRAEALLLFNLPPEYSIDVLQTRYKQLRSARHPDRGGGTEEFDQIQRAYRLLCRPGICPVCDGRGSTRIKEGAITKKVPCPRCWR